MGLGVDKELDHAYKNGVEELGIMQRLFYRIHRFCWISSLHVSISEAR